MQPKYLLVSTLSIASIVSAQSSEDITASTILSIVDGYASALANVPPQKLNSLTAYLASAETGSALIAAATAITATDGVVFSQEQSFYANAATATNAPLPAYVSGLPSSAQSAVSSYYAGAASIIAPAGSPSPASSSGGSSTTAASSQPSSSGGSSALSQPSSSSGSSTSSQQSSSSGSSTSSQPSSSGGSSTSSQPSSSSSSSTSSSASARASNDAAAQHPGTFMAVAAGALGMAALL